MLLLPKKKKSRGCNGKWKCAKSAQHSDERRIKEPIVTSRNEVIAFLVAYGVLFPLFRARLSLGRDGETPRKRFSFFKQLAGLAGCSCFRLHSFRRRKYNAAPVQISRIRITVPSECAARAIPLWENEIISRLMASGIADIQPTIGCSPVAAVPPGSFARELKRPRNTVFRRLPIGPGHYDAAPE